MKEETSTWREVGKVCFRDCATINRSVRPGAEEEPHGAGVTPTVPQGFSFGPKASFRKRTLLLQSARVLRPAAHWWQLLVAVSAVSSQLGPLWPPQVASWTPLQGRLAWGLWRVRVRRHRAATNQASH